MNRLKSVTPINQIGLYHRLIFMSSIDVLMQSYTTSLPLLRESFRISPFLPRFWRSMQKRDMQLDDRVVAAVRYQCGGGRNSPLVTFPLPPQSGQGALREIGIWLAKNLFKFCTFFVLKHWNEIEISFQISCELGGGLHISRSNRWPLKADKRICYLYIQYLRGISQIGSSLNAF